jgi:hypothetical protein
VVFHCRLAVSLRILSGTCNPRFDCRYASRHANVTNCGHSVWSTTRRKAVDVSDPAAKTELAAEEEQLLIAPQHAVVGRRPLCGAVP